ncbi:Serpin B4 [Thelohanellus kitauei]|uniref:Serpin B4 n=1 Tax=Thelohanellus kitauei TaxID=669202 RepID=A0A0C2IPX1_THEKT|nr:Serpin B4 [Thelohanellus kitauei]
MNDWVIRRTYGSIGHIFDGWMQSESMMVFIHTLFYRADWTNNFENSRTKQDIFYDDNGQPHESLNKIFELHGYNFRILFKPLKHSDFVSAIVLPRNGQKVKDILKNFKLNEMHTYFEQSKLMNVKFKMPKFKISRKDDLAQTLKKFGIIDMFDPDLSDFGMMTNHSVFIGNLMQVINLDIGDMDQRAADEPEAMEMESSSETYKFYVRKPFLFFVYSPVANVALFSAVVTNPGIA